MLIGRRAACGARVRASHVDVCQRVILEIGRVIELVEIGHYLVERAVEVEPEHADGLAADLAEVIVLEYLGLELSLVRGIVDRITEVEYLRPRCLDNGGRIGEKDLLGREPRGLLADVPQLHREITHKYRPPPRGQCPRA